MEINDSTAMGAVATMGAAVIGAVVALWKNLTGRIAAIDKKVDTKADATRVEGIAANLSEAFQNQREDNSLVLEAIRGMTGVFHQHQLAYAENNGEIKLQLGRIASDMESEKRTRAQSNSRIDERFNDIEERISRGTR